jgi:hypothetical protein
MRFSSFILALVTAIFPVAESKADNCQFTFKCQGNICERALPASCLVNSPVANVVVNTSPSHTASVDSSAIGSTQTKAAFVQPEQSPGNPTLSPPSPIGPGCAENGSCFGDISSINGMPKTTHVNGYFRRDGTYVRGHYRSSGRR